MSYIHCPICHRRINWTAAAPYRFNAQEQAEPLIRDPLDSEESWQERLTTAYRPCAEADEPGTHWLPYDYADYTPITIGMIGQTAAGKTHLLAAMIYRLCSGDPVLDRLGLAVAPLDLRVHRRYVAASIAPLISQRRELGATPAAGPIEFCDALKVTNGRNQTFALIFFDLAGERLQRTTDEVRFYASANALIFVVDAAALPRRMEPRTTAAGGDASFEMALQRIGRRPRPPGVASFQPVAAAVVVAKADLIEFEDKIVSDWLVVGSSEEEVALDTVEQESEDVYAYLTQRGAGPWLRPAKECYRSTLHFASATNSAPVAGAGRDRVFPSRFRQRRVLKPLLSVFAMTGILDERALAPAGGPR